MIAITIEIIAKKIKIHNIIACKDFSFESRKNPN
jgi:hypothetical protein